jgi:hypothetical protein
MAELLRRCMDLGLPPLAVAEAITNGVAEPGFPVAGS